MIVRLRSSAFHSDSIQPAQHTHAFSRWQVDVTGGDFIEPVYDSDWTTDLLEHFVPDGTLDEDTAYDFRVAHMDGVGIESLYSDPVTISAVSSGRPLERAWAFVFDGHVFYVMNFIDQPALIYDALTEQWYRWSTYGTDIESTEPYWNMFRGIVWNGRVLAADATLAKIWEMDPTSMLDEETLPIERVVTGFQFLRGSASARVGSMRVTARKENAEVEADLIMRFSDDGGKTWSHDFTVTLDPSSYSQRIEFRSLGRLRAPGRIWEIRDTGGFVRIEGADADVEGMQ